ncbi:MAG TPA: RHS repeat-associated core domain-containing protein [Allosphingosinicella sp.]
MTYGYDLLGRMVSASQPGHALSFSYDALGRQLSESGPLGTVSSSWDAAGRRTALTDPGGFTALYTYLVTGELRTIQQPGSGPFSPGIVLATFGYDPATNAGQLGLRTSISRANGAATSYGYDAALRLSQIAHSGTSQNVTFTYGYNPAGQIVSRESNNDPYSYSGDSAGTTSTRANGLNQLQSRNGATVGHDAKGNTLNDPSFGYSYGHSSENQLTSVGGSGWSLGLSYDPLDRLYQAGSTRFLHDGTDLIAEYNSFNMLQRRFVHGPGVDEPLVWYEGTGTGDRRFLHADERGSIVAVSNGSGTVTNINRYDEYRVPASTNVGRFQYTGQKWIGEIGRYDYKARMYWPGGGRFMQPDPIGYGSGVNMYAYVGGDPVNFTDPTGLETQAQCQALKAAEAAKGDAGALVVCGGSRSGGGGWGNAGALLGGGRSGGGGAMDGGGGGAPQPTETAESSRTPQACPLLPPSPAMMNEATNSALASIYGQGNGRPTTSALTSEFSRISGLPDFSRNGWRPVHSSHAPYAYERSIPGSTDVIKVYINDSHNNGLNTATITSSTRSAGHFLNWPFYQMGLPVNALKAANYIRSNCIVQKIK